MRYHKATSKTRLHNCPAVICLCKQTEKFDHLIILFDEVRGNNEKVIIFLDSANFVDKGDRHLVNMMELKNIFLEPTSKTPQIDLNKMTGDLIFSGRSIPENAVELYENILKWIVKYAEDPRRTTNLRFNLEYFNTASSIWLAKIVKALCSIKEPECVLMIHIYFNIEEFDSMEVEDLKEALSPIIDMIGTPTVSLGIKIYGTDDKGEIIKESIVLI